MALNSSTTAETDSPTEVQQQADDDAQFLAQMRRWVIVALLVVGVALVLWSNSLGNVSVADYHNNWNPDDAARAALTIRTLGAMAFGAGMVERVLLWYERLAQSRKA